MSAVVKRKNPNWVASVLGNVTTLAGKEIACGFPKGKAQAYPDGEGVASVAAKNCFGIGVPQRDFMSYAQPLIIERTRATMARIAKLVELPGQGDKVAALMETAGIAAANAIKRAIRDGDWSPNSDKPMGELLRADISRSWQVSIPVGMSYAAAKKKFHKSSKPLIDTGHMIQSATSVVRDKA